MKTNKTHIDKKIDIQMYILNYRKNTYLHLYASKKKCERMMFFGTEMSFVPQTEPYEEHMAS